MFLWCFFFFKQKTAYEMRISDWSSDVCSSDLAMEAGLDIVSGLHTRLTSIPALVEAARRTGRRLIDVRTPPPSIPIATGRKRSGKRLLTVGTDCAPLGRASCRARVCQYV